MPEIMRSYCSHQGVFLYVLARAMSSLFFSVLGSRVVALGGGRAAILGDSSLMRGFADWN